MSLPKENDPLDTIDRKEDLEEFPSSKEIERFRDGDPEALADVIRRYDSLVRSIVGRYFRSPWDQEEALQDIWLHVIRQREAVDVARAQELPKWIAVLAKRRSIDLLRQARARPAENAKETGVEVTDLPSEPRQVNAVESAELRAAVNEFKAGLLPQWREVFQRQIVEGRSHPEVARTLGVPVARSKYVKRLILAKARRNRRLMGALGKTLPWEEDPNAS